MKKTKLYTLRVKEAKHIVYYDECPNCHKEISGIDPKSCIRNIEKHLTKCQNKLTKDGKQKKYNDRN